jgi:hypothetical protein
MSYEEKYLKYKNKYLELKSQILSMETEQEESGITKFFSNLGLNNLFGGAPKLTEEGPESSPDSERQAQIPVDEQNGGRESKSRNKLTRTKAKKSGRKHFFDDSDIKKDSSDSESNSDFSSSDLDW